MGMPRFELCFRSIRHARVVTASFYQATPTTVLFRHTNRFDVIAVQLNRPRLGLHWSFKNADHRDEGNMCDEVNRWYWGRHWPWTRRLVRHVANQDGIHPQTDSRDRQYLCRRGNRPES